MEQTVLTHVAILVMVWDVRMSATVNTKPATLLEAAHNLQVLSSTIYTLGFDLVHLSLEC